MSDLFAAQDEACTAPRGCAERAHRDGVLRGVAFLGVFALVGLTFASNAANVTHDICARGPVRASAAER